MINEAENTIRVDPVTNDIFGKGLSQGKKNFAYKRVFDRIFVEDSQIPIPTYHGLVSLNANGYITGSTDAISCPIANSYLFEYLDSLDEATLQRLYYMALYVPFITRSLFWSKLIQFHKDYGRTPFLGKCGCSAFTLLDFKNDLHKYKIDQCLQSWQMDACLAAYVSTLSVWKDKEIDYKIIQAYYYSYYARPNQLLTEDKKLGLWKDGMFINKDIYDLGNGEYGLLHHGRILKMDLKLFDILEESKDFSFYADHAYVFTYLCKSKLTDKKITASDCRMALGFNLF